MPFRKHWHRFAESDQIVRQELLTVAALAFFLPTFPAPNRVSEIPRFLKRRFQEQKNTVVDLSIHNRVFLLFS